MSRHSKLPLLSFQRYLHDLGLTGITQALYLSAVRQFLTPCATLPLDQITVNTISQHLDELPPSRHTHFRTGWTHFRAWALREAARERRTLVLAELPSTKHHARDSYKYIYPVYWEHLLPLLDKTGMQPAEAYTMTLENIELNTSAKMIEFHTHHPKGRGFGVTRYGKHEEIWPHVKAIFDWGWPNGFKDGDSPFLPESPEAVMPIGKKKLRVILAGARLDAERAIRARKPQGTSPGNLGSKSGLTVSPVGVDDGPKS